MIAFYVSLSLLKGGPLLSSVLWLLETNYLNAAQLLPLVGSLVAKNRDYTHRPLTKGLESLPMRSRLELSPFQRFVCSMAAVALLLWGAAGGHGRFFAALVGFYIIVYTAAGGRVPWKISWRDYFLYVAISVSLVIAIVLYAWMSR